MATPSDVELANAAIRLGFLRKEQAIECLKIVHALALKGTTKSVADIFVEQRLLSHEQAGKLLTQPPAQPTVPVQSLHVAKAALPTSPPQVGTVKPSGAPAAPTAPARPVAPPTSPPQIGAVRPTGTAAAPPTSPPQIGAVRPTGMATAPRTSPPQIGTVRPAGAPAAPHTSPPQIGVVRPADAPGVGQGSESQPRTASPGGPVAAPADRRTEPPVTYPQIIERRTGTQPPGGAQQLTKSPSSQALAAPAQAKSPSSRVLPTPAQAKAPASQVFATPTQAKPSAAPPAQAQQPDGAQAVAQARQTPSGAHPAPIAAPAACRPAPQAQKAPTPVPQTQKTPPPAPAKPAQPQDPIPGYKIVGKIGMGGMATVFKALDSKNGNRVVALKILFPHHAKNEVFLQRFIRESELLVKFDHVNIVRGYDNGVANTLYYLAMEYIEGKSVQNMIDETGSMQEEVALDIILQIARGLAYIQEQGIVHRDVKPDNVLMTHDGVVKLCDLGFAKLLGGPTPGAAAATEDLTCGTPQYMSPEQAQGEMALDIRSDIYALGATLYHMALGTLPFKGTDNMEIMAKQVLESLDSAEVKSRKISKHMHYFIERMMSKDKDFRYQSPQEMVEDIEIQMEGWRTLQFNPDEVETSLGGFLQKPMKSQPTTRKFGGPRQPPDRPSTRFLRRKP